MKFSREFYFRASFFRAFYFRAPPFFSLSRKSNFRATAKKVWFCQTKTSQMLVFCWYLVKERKKIKISLLRIAQFYFRALLVARITLIRADYIFAQEHCAKIKLTRKFHELRRYITTINITRPNVLSKLSSALVTVSDSQKLKLSFLVTHFAF